MKHRTIFVGLAWVWCSCQSNETREGESAEALKVRMAQLSSNLDKNNTDVKELQASNEKERSQIASASARADALLAEVRGLEQKWSEVSGLFRDAEATFRKAKDNYEVAKERTEEAARSFARANEAFMEAEKNYRQVAFALVAAAASDAVGEAVCKNTMSTQKYRKQLKAQDPTLDLTGEHVDHVWPKALGGADNRWNYQLLDASKNMSWQDSVWPKFQNMPLATVQGLVVSALSALRC